jgi:uncharacterized LabA/DUF88 family protein
MVSVLQPLANVYVDGFNLYNRALRGGPYKWLDLEKLSDRLLRRYEIKRVRYFTARIRAITGTDPKAPSRQQTYLRALATNPKVSIHYGQFTLSKPRMAVHPLALDSDGQVVTQQVRKMEEKGSDVNIATYMMYDAFRDDADAYVLLSNDSDLAETLRLLANEMRRDTGIIFPAATHANELIKTNPSIVRQVREGTLRASQLPTTLRDDVGTITKPVGW